MRRRLLREDDAREDIVDEVHHHWVTQVLPALEGVAGLAGPRAGAPGAGATLGWVLLLGAIAVLGHAAWRALVEFMDVFVITNMRVFRVSGVFSSRHATTPLARILDITVDQPLTGLVLGTATSPSSRPPRSRVCARSASCRGPWSATSRSSAWCS